MLMKTIALASAGALIAISAPVSAAPKNGNIVATVVTSENHTTLETAVKAAGLVDTLAMKGPYTVFAPTDAAFAKLPAGTVDTLLMPASKDQLQSILTYHVVSGQVTAADLIEKINAHGGSYSFKTVQGSELTARLSDGKVMITDASGRTATVTQADLKRSNGVIHVTDTVFLPG